MTGSRSWIRFERARTISTVIRPGVPPMQIEANFRVEHGEIVSLFLQPA